MTSERSYFKTIYRGRVIKNSMYFYFFKILFFSTKKANSTSKPELASLLILCILWNKYPSCDPLIDSQYLIGVGVGEFRDQHLR